MKVTLITPDSSQKFNKDVPCIFLAGPLGGTRDWRNEVKEYFKNQEGEELVIFSPENKHFKDLEIQADWETKYLNYAYKNGLIAFYCSNQTKYDSKRGYARTTRFELGEWIVKYTFGNKDKKNLITIGIESEFEGKEYIIHRLINNYNIADDTILDNIEDFCEIIYEKLF